MLGINMAEDSELHALMSRDLERAKRLAQEHGAPFYYDSVDGILSDPEVDVAYVATPVYLHCDQVVRAAEHGKHVLCEKPMAMSVDECERMIDACDQNGVHLEICFLLRFHPRYRRIKQLVADGEFGEIIEARAPFLKWYPMEEGLWRRDPAKSGGGVLMDLGSHSIDLLTYLLGDVSKVVALVNSRTAKWEVEETATVIMQMKSGAHAIVDTSFVVPHNESALEIYGTKGSVLVAGGKAKTYIHDSVREESEPSGNVFKARVEHFSRYIEGEEEPVAPGIAGLKNIQIISAAYESARTGKIISILDT
jgi:predicted dehydrogenase